MRGSPVTVYPRGSWEDDSSSDTSSSSYSSGSSEPSVDADNHHYSPIFDDVDALIFDISHSDKALASLQYTDGFSEGPSEGTSSQVFSPLSDDVSTSLSTPSLGQQLPGTKRKRQRGEFPFACPFHKFRPEHFRIQYGTNGHNRFKSCSGPRWTDIRNLGLKTWENVDDRDNHLSQEPRVDCPDQSHDIRQIESISHELYFSIKEILSTPRSRKKASPSGHVVKQLTSREKWYAVKDKIFPPAKYGYFNPKHPFYQDPDGDSINPSDVDREKVQQLAKTMFEAAADEAVKKKEVSDAGTYRLSKTDAVKFVVDVFDVWAGRVSSTRPLLPNAPGEISMPLYQMYSTPPNHPRRGDQLEPEAPGANIDQELAEMLQSLKNAV
ncbi:hypothetical protein F5Y10DRAFT_284674 [Nemania abortiva]|nr:hypothetical protein F5Y10DRAFT_284674 [Nemania abortiva]